MYAIRQGNKQEWERDDTRYSGPLQFTFFYHFVAAWEEFSCFVERGRLNIFLKSTDGGRRNDATNKLRFLFIQLCLSACFASFTMDIILLDNKRDIRFLFAVHGHFGIAR